MRKLALLITLLGFLILISILIFQKPLEITNSGQLSSLTQNQLVQVSGIITKQTQKDNIYTLALNNNLSLIYSGKYQNFLNKNVTITGIYDNFLYNKIKVLKIQINDN